MVGHHLAVARSINEGTREVAVVGQHRSQLVDVFWQRYRPGMVLAQADGPTHAVPLLEGRNPGPDGALAFVCQNFACNLPTAEPTTLEEQLAPAHG